MTTADSRLVFRLVVLVLVLGVVITAIFGWVVRNNVLETADRTDLEMRAVAWACIVHACANDGLFPTSGDQLLAVEPLPATIDCVPGPGASWPVTLEDALRGQPAPSLVEALDRLDVVFPSDGTLPPLVGSDGLPTLIDPPTKDTIREWLTTWPVPGDG